MANALHTAPRSTTPFLSRCEAIMGIRSLTSLFAVSSIFLACSSDVPEVADAPSAATEAQLSAGASCGRNSARRLYLADAETCTRLRVAAPAGGLTFFTDACGCGYATDPDAKPPAALLRPHDTLADAPSDPFKVTATPVVARDHLVITLEHGGGCRPHGFDLHVADRFLESLPVQMEARLVHTGFADPCNALYRREVRVDLSPLRDAYRAAYRAEHGAIALRIEGLAAVPYRF